VGKPTLRLTIDAEQGMGLRVARQLTDTLAIPCGPNGTVVRFTIGR
jgi:hypothetical protein